jgi:hypothetical protein
MPPSAEIQSTVVRQQSEAKMSLKFIKPERVWLTNHPEYREAWVQERIAEDPSILGLGEG